MLQANFSPTFRSTRLCLQFVV